MVASSRASTAPESARSYGKASLVLSIVGIVIGVLIVILVIVIEVIGVVSIAVLRLKTAAVNQETFYPQLFNDFSVIEMIVAAL